MNSSLDSESQVSPSLIVLSEGAGKKGNLKPKEFLNLIKRTNGLDGDHWYDRNFFESTSCEFGVNQVENNESCSIIGNLDLVNLMIKVPWVSQVNKYKRNTEKGLHETVSNEISRLCDILNIKLEIDLEICECYFHKRFKNTVGFKEPSIILGKDLDSGRSVNIGALSLFWSFISLMAYKMIEIVAITLTFYPAPWDVGQRINVTESSCSSYLLTLSNYQNGNDVLITILITYAVLLPLAMPISVVVIQMIDDTSWLEILSVFTLIPLRFVGIMLLGITYLGNPAQSTTVIFTFFYAFGDLPTMFFSKNYKYTIDYLSDSDKCALREETGLKRYGWFSLTMIFTSAYILGSIFFLMIVSIANA